jgi:Uma2 family endonuclease
MTVHQTIRMSAEEFLAWAEGRPGRYELHNGEVVAMSPGQTGHAKIKYQVAHVLDDAIAKAGCGCWMLLTAQPCGSLSESL